MAGLQQFNVMPVQVWLEVFTRKINNAFHFISFNFDSFNYFIVICPNRFGVFSCHNFAECS